MSLDNGWMDNRLQEPRGGPSESWDVSKVGSASGTAPGGHSAGLRALELCMGAGGMALGLRTAGIDHALGLEWEPEAAGVASSAGFPTQVEDCARVDWASMPEVDLLCGGIPCQAWSQSGKREGARDSRNGFPWVFRALVEMRKKPRWCLFENVPGLLMHSAKAGCVKGKTPRPLDCPGCYFGEVVLGMLKMHYPWVGHVTLDAADFGVPQRRSRVFIVAGPCEVEWPEPTHSQTSLVHAKWISGTYWQEHGIDRCGAPSKSEARVLKKMQAGESEGLNLPRWRTVRDALGIGGTLHLRSEHVGAGATTPDEPSPTTNGVGNLYLHARNPGRRGPCETLPKHEHVIAVCGGGNPHGPGKAHERNVRDLTDEPATCIAADESGNGHLEALIVEPWQEDPKHPILLLDEPALPVRSDGDGHTAPPVYVRQGFDLAGAESWRLDIPSPAVLATEGQGARHMGAATEGRSPARASDALWRATGRRRLSEAECAILQGFPPNHPFHLIETSQLRYRAVGNACPPALADAVARTVIAADAHYNREGISAVEYSGMEKVASLTTPG